MRKKANFRVDADLGKNMTAMIDLGFDAVCITYALAQISDFITPIDNLAIRKTKISALYEGLKAKGVELDSNLVAECTYLQTSLDPDQKDAEAAAEMPIEDKVESEVAAEMLTEDKVESEVAAEMLTEVKVESEKGSSRRRDVDRS